MVGANLTASSISSPLKDVIVFWRVVLRFPHFGKRIKSLGSITVLVYCMKTANHIIYRHQLGTDPS